MLTLWCGSHVHYSCLTSLSLVPSGTHITYFSFHHCITLLHPHSPPVFSYCISLLLDLLFFSCTVLCDTWLCSIKRPWHMLGPFLWLLPCQVKPTLTHKLNTKNLWWQVTCCYGFNSSIGTSILGVAFPVSTLRIRMIKVIACTTLIYNY